MCRIPECAAKAVSITGCAALQKPHQFAPNSNTVGPCNFSTVSFDGSGSYGWVMTFILDEQCAYCAHCSAIHEIPERRIDVSTETFARDQAMRPTILRMVLALETT